MCQGELIPMGILFVSEEMGRGVMGGVSMMVGLGEEGGRGLRSACKMINNNNKIQAML